ncbi:hypothetical protein [Psychroserpens sp.]|uniref:hypothetical protein n=1 Tax=Psychroserpens sp. TaxID=2020870 RepID=UPI00385F8094
MTEFNDLKSQWTQQPKTEAPNNGSKDIIKRISFLKKKQQIANIVLSITVLILVVFFFYINAYSHALVSFALFLMISVLLVRIILEYLSMSKLNKLDVTTNVTSFKQDITKYYKNRLKTHYIFTPIILILYIVGFIILMPFFKDNLSHGFYIYISISGIFVLLILGFFIGIQIKKELEILQQIKN